MNASAGAPPGKGREEGWDETVLVWNATVARIPARAVQPDVAQDGADLERGDATPNRRAGGGASRRRGESNGGRVDSE